MTGLYLLLAIIAVYVFVKGLRVCAWQFGMWATRNGDRDFLWWTIRRKDKGQQSSVGAGVKDQQFCTIEPAGRRPWRGLLNSTLSV